VFCVYQIKRDSERKRATFRPQNTRGDTRQANSPETVVEAPTCPAGRHRWGPPSAEGPVVGKITSPAGRTERLEFAPVEGGWGVFKASFLPQDGGTYRVAITSDKYGRKLETDLVVAQPQREKQGQPINLEVLREIASITHGALAGPDDLEKIIQQISLLPEPKPIEKRIRLWSDPRWGGLLLALLAVYWTGRKLSGMV
jgi:hypothetical protein